MFSMTISLWWVYGAFLVLIILMGILFYLLYIGGSFLRQKAKAKSMPFKNKGAWIEFIKKDGRSYLFYIIIGKDNKIELRGDKYQLDECTNILKDCTNQVFDKQGNPRPTKNYYDGDPKYFIVEGCPTNVLVKSRDYDQDISKLQEVRNTIQKIILSGIEADATKYKEKLISVFYSLYNSDLKYTPSIHKLVRDFLETELQLSQLKDEEEQPIKYTDIDILKEFDNKIINIIREMALKNKTNINFTEYFNSGKLSEIYAKHTSFAYLLGILKAGAINQLKKLMWFIIIALVVACLILGYIGIDTQKKIEKLGTQISILSSDMNIMHEKINEMTIIKNIPSSNIPNSPANLPSGGVNG